MLCSNAANASRNFLVFAGMLQMPRETFWFWRKISANIPLQKKKLVGRRHWIGNEVETSEALEVVGICTNKGRLSFEAAMLL
ncbi:hypothetical protein T229_13340 [Tannerella sp. oral taxon BU063 isolate Cell 5]|uniref:Uncharacterized protein n=1 Tax=Tannerella sp. oral taxon BU063 isolate Cell 5 TaxID=1410950 RepID=W2C8R2_9BACT|nr:hypothetical protein T229_13340 [Tannerella sp. oral taxon BU063 isolate Cell 5]